MECCPVSYSSGQANPSRGLLNIYKKNVYPNLSPSLSSSLLLLVSTGKFTCGKFMRSATTSISSAPPIREPSWTCSSPQTETNLSRHPQTKLSGYSIPSPASASRGSKVGNLTFGVIRRTLYLLGQTFVWFRPKFCE